MSDNGMHSMRGRSVLIVEAAGILGVSRRTVYYRIREGRLQTIRTRGGSQRVLWSSIEPLLRDTQAVALAGAEAPGREGPAKLEQEPREVTRAASEVPGRCVSRQQTRAGQNAEQQLRN